MARKRKIPRFTPEEIARARQEERHATPEYWKSMVRDLDRKFGDTWTVWSLDVWGNERDGYQVNDRSRAGTVRIRRDAPDAEIVRSLVRGGFLRKGVTSRNVDIRGQEILEVEDAGTGEPVLQLTLER